jgi:transmembrane sensor
MTKKSIDKSNLGALIWISELFGRYYDKKATPKEAAAIEEWNPEKEGQPDIRFFKKDIRTERIWNEIAYELGFVTVKKNIWLQGQMLQRYTTAAVVLLFISLGFYIYNEKQGIDSNQQIVILKDYFETGHRQKKLTLPDGTTVTMNSDSKLGIAMASFNDKTREVWLEEGEAFFEVAENPAKPFIVHARNLETTVKGTSFNVKAYRELDQNSVSVRSGKVAVSNDGKLLGELTKNEQIIYNKNNGEIQNVSSNWRESAAWMEHRLVMKRADIKELRLRLRQQFDVELIANNDVLKGTLLNSTFEKGVSLKQVLDVISAVYDVKYDLSQKGKVIIYK